MSTTVSARIARVDLELGAKIGSGAQGSLYAVRDVKGEHGIELPFDVVYKEFHPNTQVSGPSLEVLARFRQELDDHDREVIDAMTVWPCIVVDDGSGRSCGYLMQQLPERFLQPIETTAGSERIAREIQQLFVPEAIARKNLGETATKVERLAVARDAAFVLGFLHKRDFVYGDLSYKNAVFCLRPHPGVMLLDCDAVRKLGQAPAVAQLHSPGWKPPEGGPQTKATDRYKLGLCVLRCLTPGVNAQNRDPAKASFALDSEGMSLLRRALGDVPEERTTGKEWVLYLNKAIANAGGVKQRTGPAPAPRPASIRRAPAASTATTGVRRAARAAVFGTAPPPTQVFTRGRNGALRVQPVRTVTPSAWNPTGPSAKNAFGNPVGTGPQKWSSASPPSSAQGFVALAIAGLVLVTALVIFGLGGTLTNISSSSSKTTARATTGTGTAYQELQRAAERWSSDAAAAVRLASTKVDSAAWKPAAISSSGTTTPSANQLSGAPTHWVVEFIDPTTGSDTGTPLKTLTFEVVGASIKEPTATERTGSAQPLPDAWRTGLNRAISYVGGGSRFDALVDIAWVCPSRSTSVDCRWRFVFVRDGTTEKVFVSPDGSTTTAQPSWYQD